ncbi:MAG: protein kinase [Acidobacteriota bacterium]
MTNPRTDTETRQRCPQCRAPLPRPTPEGAGGIGTLCPACLLSRALGEPDDETLAWSTDPPPEPDPSPRLEQLGDYRLLRRLGRGGMGRVYEAEHSTTGRCVALKRLGHRLDSPEMRRRFLREGRLAASVSHPNSLYVFGSEDIEGTPVITMEIAGGGTLQDELAQRGPFSVDAAVDAVLDVIAGLEAAQVAGVQHRDVKPSNCFRMPDGTVKVGDYGLSISALARDDSVATVAGMVLGTPAYASPEQLRGDDLDVRADIYSVGATLYSLLTGHPPFDGKNAVQVVANAVKLEAPRLRDSRPEVPPELERIVTRCLAKEPDGRFAGYGGLRYALLPFSSKQREAASIKARAAAGWIDFLIALLPPYVVTMLAVGSLSFHFGWLTERTITAALPFLTCFAVGILYFTLAEGLWGGGFGKRRAGLQVVRADGRKPGLLRALVRIVVPLALVEGVRIPILLATIDARSLDQLTGREGLIYTLVTTFAPWGVAVVLGLFARPANGFAAPWDLLSGTRVVFRPKGLHRPRVEPLDAATFEATVEATFEATVEASSSASAPRMVGPFRVERSLVAGRWVAGVDPVLRRPVWLLARRDLGPSEERQRAARPGRPRWLQKIDTPDRVWDAFEASPGRPLASLVASSRRLPWADLRHWLYDLALELRAGAADHTLPPALGLHHVWLTAGGRALILDQAWPSGPAHADSANEVVAVEDLAGQQRFLHTVAACAEPTSLPLHARPVVTNLGRGRFEKLSFLAGTLRGLLDRPAALSRGLRAGALFLLPTYCWVMTLVGSRDDIDPLKPTLAALFGSTPVFLTLVILACAALVQLVMVPLRTTNGHALFRLAVVDAAGRLASRWRLLARWAAAWLPLIALLALSAALSGNLSTPFTRLWLALWLAAAVWAALDPHRGLHDRVAGTWVVRR